MATRSFAELETVRPLYKLAALHLTTASSLRLNRHATVTTTISQPRKRCRPFLPRLLLLKTSVAHVDIVDISSSPAEACQPKAPTPIKGPAVDICVAKQPHEDDTGSGFSKSDSTDDGATHSDEISSDESEFEEGDHTNPPPALTVRSVLASIQQAVLSKSPAPRRSIKVFSDGARYGLGAYTSDGNWQSLAIAHETGHTDSFLQEAHAFLSAVNAWSKSWTNIDIDFYSDCAPFINGFRNISAVWKRKQSHTDEHWAKLSSVQRCLRLASENLSARGVKIRLMWLSRLDIRIRLADKLSKGKIGGFKQEYRHVVEKYAFGALKQRTV